VLIMFRSALVATLFGAAVAEGQYSFAKGYVRRARAKALRTVAPLSKEARERTPDAIDWSTRGATTPVKDQGICGDCWAFSAVEGVESALFMSTGKLVGLSEQQVTSCDTVDLGCHGGDPANAFEYIMEAGGLALQVDYPDTSPASGDTGECAWDASKAAVVADYNYAIPPCVEGWCDGQDEDALAAAVAEHGPLSVCVNAATWPTVGDEGKLWTTEEVWTGDCPHSAADLDHCVQLVGYDRTAPTPYWKIRNSWTSQWAEQGFLRLPFGKNACGIANEAYVLRVALADASVSLVV